MVRATMIKTKNTPSELEEVCKELLRQEEAAGRRRSEIALECNIRQNQINKWLDEGQGMSSESIGKVLKGLGRGMTPKMIARLIRISGKREKLIESLISIVENQPDHVVDKVEHDLRFWNPDKNKKPS